MKITKNTHFTMTTNILMILAFLSLFMAAYVIFDSYMVKRSCGRLPITDYTHQPPSAPAKCVDLYKKGQLF